MVRISGVEIPDDKRIEIALTSIFGIGKSSAKRILFESGIDRDKKSRDLKEEEIGKIRDIIENDYKTEGELKTEIVANINRLKDIGSYRGQRHSKNLPVRGQRTKTNARTKRGRRMTVGSGRKKGLEKT